MKSVAEKLGKLTAVPWLHIHETRRLGKKRQNGRIEEKNKTRSRSVHQSMLTITLEVDVLELSTVGEQNNDFQQGLKELM